jgi:RNA polymerase sigma-70 factor (ECF subfamily)
MLLSPLFLRAAGGRASAWAAVGDLEQRLRAALDEGGARWPGVQLVPESFIPYLAARVASGPAPDALAAAHVQDLYLACACGRGDDAAVAAFERELLAPVAALAVRASDPGGFADELKQGLRLRLLVASPTAPARIVQYDGRGPLGGWVRVAAARLATNLRSVQRTHLPLGGDADAALAAGVPDPELAFLKTHYRKEFEVAFRSVLQALSDRDANLLRLHYLEGASPVALAGAYQVAPRTVYHWIAETRRSILEAVRRQLSDRLAITPAEFENLLTLVQSQLDLSIHRFLNERE